MIVVWILAIVVGMGVALLASRKAVDHASTLAFGLKVPPFLVGLTLLAIGTDLPEIANSIIVADPNEAGDEFGVLPEGEIMLSFTRPFVSRAT